MTDTTVAYPSPHADDLSAPYWEGTKHGDLVIQRCVDCGRLRHYPQVLCIECHSDNFDFVEVSGRGRIHSWTVSHHAFHPAFAGDLPYALVTVDIDEGVRVLGRLEGLALEDLAIDMKVRATFPARPDGFGQLTFIPA